MLRFFFPQLFLQDFWYWNVCDMKVNVYDSCTFMHTTYVLCILHSVRNVWCTERKFMHFNMWWHQQKDSQFYCFALKQLVPLIWKNRLFVSSFSVVNAIRSEMDAHIGADGGDTLTINNTLLDFLAPIRPIVYGKVNEHGTDESSAAIEWRIKERLEWSPVCNISKSQQTAIDKNILVTTACMRIPCQVDALSIFKHLRYHRISYLNLPDLISSVILIIFVVFMSWSFYRVSLSLTISLSQCFDILFLSSYFRMGIFLCAFVCTRIYIRISSFRFNCHILSGSLRTHWISIYRFVYIQLIVPTSIVCTRISRSQKKNTKKHIFLWNLDTDTDAGNNVSLKMDQYLWIMTHVIEFRFVLSKI